MDAASPETCSTCPFLLRENTSLRAEAAHLKEELRRSRELLEEARRAGKRQAAPFSKGPPKADPREPGRKPDAAYGRRGERPRPDHVDESMSLPSIGNSNGAP